MYERIMLDRSNPLRSENIVDNKDFRFRRAER
jgi:hypothetical protein